MKLKANTSVVWMALAAGLVCATGLARGAGQEADGPPRFAERAGELEFSGELVVRPRQDLSPERSRTARARLAPYARVYYASVDEYIVRVPRGAGREGVRGSGENDMAAALMATGDYLYAQPNWVCYPLQTPNDPGFAAQWHHTNMQSTLGWDISTGSPPIVVAITDSGVDLTHPDLQNRVTGYNAVDDLAEVDGGQIGDVASSGHGTHVSGCAAAKGNNGAGVVGLGWNLSFMMCRVSNKTSGGAYLDDLAQGARWTIENGARSVSASYTGVSGPSVGTTGDYIDSIGGIYLYAAGNSNSDLWNFDHANVIVVGATTQADTKASFSSYGLAIDVVAPGVDIYSTLKNGTYGLMSGTSMATPLVNGVIGMIWSVNPALTNHEVRDILFNSCDDIGDPGDDDIFGHGRVNLARALAAAEATLGCGADVNHDGFVNGDDYDVFAELFDVADPGADFNHDGFVNGNDFDAFADHFDEGC